MSPAGDDPPKSRASDLASGCLIVLALLALGGVAYVLVTDHFAVQAAKKLCTREHVLQVRQPEAYQQYVRELQPTGPLSISTAQITRIRGKLGITRDYNTLGQEHVTVLRNARGEIARLTEVWATSAAWSFDAPRKQIFSCYDKYPSIYRDAWHVF